MSRLSREASNLLETIARDTKMAAEARQNPSNELRELINEGLIGMRLGYDAKTGQTSAYYVLIPAIPANSNPRDTQFAGFAAILLQEIDAAVAASLKMPMSHLHTQDLSHQQFANKLGTIIARRAYDLVEHTVEFSEDQEAMEGARLTSDYLLRHVPDMTIWPEESKG